MATNGTLAFYLLFLPTYRYFRKSAVLKESWKQQITKQQLYSNQPPISKTIQIRRIRHAGHRQKRKDEFLSDFLLWTPSHGRARVRRPARTYLQQLCTDTRYSLDDQQEVIDERDEWREREREWMSEWERERDR